MVLFRHRVLTALPDKNGSFLPKILRKSQKLPLFNKKCSCLVTLRSGGAKIADFRFWTKLPKIVISLYILHQKMAIFGIFSKNLVKHPQKKSGNAVRTRCLNDSGAIISDLNHIPHRSILERMGWGGCLYLHNGRYNHAMKNHTKMLQISNFEFPLLMVWKL